MSPLPIDQAPQERRRQARKRVLWGGMIASADGTTTSECVIQNINEAGALIHTPMRLEVDTKVYLLDARTYHAHVASVVRLASDEQVALRFHEFVPLSAAKSPALEFLRPLFLRAKLTQVRVLWNQGFSPEEILDFTHVDRTFLDLTEGHADISIEFSFLLSQLRSILERCKRTY